MKILRRKQVEDRTGLSIRTIFRKEQSGDFPRRIRLGANAVGWREDEVDKWIQSRDRGFGRTPTEAIAARASEE